MNDREVEDLLRRYRPVGPPADLRARVMAAGASAPRTWPWAAAAAVLLGAVCATHAWTQSVYEDVRSSVGQTPASAMSDLPGLKSAIEEDPVLRERIEMLVWQEALQSPPPPPADAGVSWQ